MMLNVGVIGLGMGRGHLQAYSTIPQVQIAALLQAGLERKEISYKLGISINTVNTQIKRMFEKCKVSNKVELLNILSGL